MDNKKPAKVSRFNRDRFNKKLIQPLVPLENSTKASPEPKVQEPIQIPLESKEDIKKRATRLEQKDTNLIFMVGYSGSSKTTVLAALSEYLSTSREYKTILRKDKDKSSMEGNKLISQVVGNLKNKEFPPITPETKLYEYDIACKKTGMEDWLQLTFLEMSGERIKRVKDEFGGEFSEELKIYLESAKQPILYLFVVGYKELDLLQTQYSSGKDHDGLFHEFISYILQNGRHNTHNPIRIGLIVSKFDKDKTQSVNFNEYVKKHLKKTVNLISDKTIVQHRKIFSFSIGKVKEAESPVPASIENLDISDCKPIADWLFQVLAADKLPTNSRVERPEKKKSFLNRLFNTKQV